MKKLFIILVFALLLAGCDSDKGNENDTYEKIDFSTLTIKDTSIKSLFIGDVSVNSARSANGATIQTIAYINNNGVSSPFFFVTPSGKNIILNTGNIEQIDDKRILLDFNSYYEVTINDNIYILSDIIYTNYPDSSGSSKTALVDFEKNKVYDLSGWQIGLYYNGFVFASTNDATIYKIDLNNASKAIPLNNREFFSFDSGIWGLYQHVINNKLIYSGYVIDINIAYPITTLKHSYVTSEMCSFIKEDSPYVVGLGSGMTFKDLSDNLWFFITGGRKPPGDSIWQGYYDNDGVWKSFKVDNGEPDKYFIGKVNIDNEGYIYLTDYYEDTFTFTPLYSGTTRWGSKGNNDLVMVCNDGFISFTMKYDGILVETTPITVSLPSQGETFIKNNYLYYKENTSIKRVHLSANSSAETVYSNNRILTTKGFKFSGDNIIFYMFADDNISVNTYSLSLKQGATPILLSTSVVEIRSIVELDF